MKESTFCVRKGSSFNTYVPKNGLKIFDWEFLSVNDSSRPVQPTEINTDKTKVLVNENHCLPARNIVDDFQISHKSILNHIRKID